MGNLSWGKPRLFIKDLDAEGAKWHELNAPVINSAELRPTKGDKMEARVEGGENEEVKYKDSTYAFLYNIRKYKGRAAPIPNKNGVATAHYGLILMPEEDGNIGFYIEKLTVTVDDTYTADDGAIWAIQHDAITASSGNTVKWGTVEVESTDDTAKLKFTETQPAPKSSAVSINQDVELLSE